MYCDDRSSARNLSSREFLASMASTSTAPLENLQNATQNLSDWLIITSGDLHTFPLQNPWTLSVTVLHRGPVARHQKVAGFEVVTVTFVELDAVGVREIEVGILRWWSWYLLGDFFNFFGGETTIFLRSKTCGTLLSEIFQVKESFLTFVSFFFFKTANSCQILT